MFKMPSENSLNSKKLETNSTSPVKSEQILCSICNITNDSIVGLITFSSFTNKKLKFNSYEESRQFFLSLTTNQDDRQRLSDFTDTKYLTSSFMQGRIRQRMQFQQIIGNKLVWLELSVLLSKLPESQEILAFYILANVEENNQLKLPAKSFGLPEKLRANRINFLSHLSHDTRTELNSLLGIVELAKEKNSSPETIRRYLNQIDNSCQTLASFFNNIIDIIKIESSVFETDQDTYTFTDFTSTVLMQITSQCKEKNIFFRYDPNNFFPAIVIDRQCFNQIFSNLFYILLKQIQGGSEISFSIEDKTVRNNFFVADFVITNTKSTFTEEQIKSIQELFKKDSLAEIYDSHDVELGFILVKMYLLVLNGKIKLVHDKKNLRNKFVISLSVPLAKEPVSGNSGSAQTLNSQLIEDFSNLEGKTVLLVEDNYLNREICIHQLTNKKMKVVQAVDGKEALQIFEKSKPGTFDAILMDIQMPVMNGYEATKAIRSLDRPDAISTPIIAMSADGLIGNIKESLSIGMVAHLTKPVTTDKLYGTLSAFCAN